MKRLRGIRANASRMSHAELDNAPELDIGNPLELGGQYAELLPPLPAHQRARRLLRHRPPPCRLHLGIMPRRVARSYGADDASRGYSGASQQS